MSRAVLEIHRLRRGQRLRALGVVPMAAAAWALGATGFLGLAMIVWAFRPGPR